VVHALHSRAAMPSTRTGRAGLLAFLLCALALGSSCDSGPLNPDSGSGGAGSEAERNGPLDSGASDGGTDGSLGHCDQDIDCVYRMQTQICICMGMCADVTDPVPPPPKSVCIIACPPPMAYACACVNHQCTNAARGAAP
jgi:hypothetical protein